MKNNSKCLFTKFCGYPFRYSTLFILQAFLGFLFFYLFVAKHEALRYICFLCSIIVQSGVTGVSFWNHLNLVKIIMKAIYNGRFCM